MTHSEESSREAKSNDLVTNQDLQPTSGLGPIKPHDLTTGLASSNHHPPWVSTQLLLSSAMLWLDYSAHCFILLMFICTIFSPYNPSKTIYPGKVQFQPYPPPHISLV